MTSTGGDVPRGQEVGVSTTGSAQRSCMKQRSIERLIESDRDYRSIEFYRDLRFLHLEELDTRPSSQAGSRSSCPGASLGPAWPWLHQGTGATAT